MSGLVYAAQPGFLSPAACETLIRVVTPYVRPAKIFNTTGDHVQSGARRADSASIPPNTGPAFAHLADSIDKFVGLDGRHAENFQFVRYGVGGGYDGHFDWHGTKVLERQTLKGGQRTWTVMLYLAAPQAGGETRFPLLNLKFKPQAGTLLAWNNLNEDGTPNPWSWHEALNVTAGEKWIVTRWYKENPVRD